MDSSRAQGETLRQLLAKAEELHSLNGQYRARIREIQTGLGALNASGFSPNRMPSTQALANEIANIQEQQQRRTGSLLQGINELLG